MYWVEKVFCLKLFMRFGYVILEVKDLVLVFDFVEDVCVVYRDVLFGDNFDYFLCDYVFGYSGNVVEFIISGL